MTHDHQLPLDDRALPSPGGVVQRVLQLLAQDAASIPLIGQALGADPVMTGRVIRLANSAAYGSRTPAASLVDAMHRIGLNALRQVLLSFALVERYRQGPCRGFDYQLFWAQSLASGIVARRLAVLKRLPAPGEAFTLGLLARVGELALATLHPDTFGTLHAELAGNTAARTAAIEGAHYGTDRYQLAARLLRDWQLPESMASAVTASVNPAASGLLPHAMSMRLARLLQIAVQLGTLFETPETASPATILAIRALCEACHVAPGELSADLPAIGAEWREWSAALDLVVRGASPDNLDPPQVAEIIPFPGVNVQPVMAPSVGDEASLAGAPPPRVAPVQTLAPAPSRSQSFVEAVRRIQRMQTLDTAPFPAPLALRILLAQPAGRDSDSLFDLLASQGHEVQQAASGNAALSAVVREPPQVVLCDLALREMDALTFLHCLRNQRSGREIYVIAVAPRDLPGALESAFGAGSDDFLGLPLRASEMLARMRGARRFLDLQERWRADHAEMRRLAGDLATANARLEGLIDIDELTGMPNRRRGNECLGEAVSRAEAVGQPLSVLLLEIDHFKDVADGWGPGAAEEVVRQTARTLQSCARAEDVVARFDSDAFLVIAPGAGAAVAAALAERLRAGVGGLRVGTTGKSLAPTVSIGASVYDPVRAARRRTPEGLLHLADEALYRARDSGRNRVCVAAEHG